MKDHTSLLESASKTAEQNLSFCTVDTGQLHKELEGRWINLDKAWAPAHAPGSQLCFQPSCYNKKTKQASCFQVLHQFLPFRGPPEACFTSPKPFARLRGPARRRLQRPLAAGSHRPPGSSRKSSPPGSRAALSLAGQGNAQWAQLRRASGTGPPTRNLRPLPQPAGMRVPGRQPCSAVPCRPPPLAFPSPPPSRERQLSLSVRPSIRLSVRLLARLPGCCCSPCPPPTPSFGTGKSRHENLVLATPGAFQTVQQAN